MLRSRHHQRRFRHVERRFAGGGGGAPAPGGGGRRPYSFSCCCCRSSSSASVAFLAVLVVFFCAVAAAFLAGTIRAPLPLSNHSADDEFYYYAGDPVTKDLLMFPRWKDRRRYRRTTSAKNGTSLSPLPLLDSIVGAAVSCLRGEGGNISNGVGGDGGEGGRRPCLDGRIERVYLIEGAANNDSDSNDIQLRVSRPASESAAAVFVARVEITEKFMVKALRTLIREKSPSRLWRAVHDEEDGRKALSLPPLLVSYGDSTFCCDDDDSDDDGKSGSNRLGIPVFSMSAPLSVRRCNHSWPIPTYETIRQSSEYPIQLRFPYFKWRYPSAFQKRSAVWRGSATGSRNYSENVRAELCRVAGARPDLIDAKLTGKIPDGWPRGGDDDDGVRRLFGEKIRMYDFQRHRAIVDVDGNSWSMRFGLLMCFNSVTLKVQPSHVDYFYPSLRPWQHYIPVRSDLSDLVEMAEYAVADENRRQVLEIMNNANAWCRRQFRTRNLERDLLRTWNEYVKMLDESDPDWPERMASSLSSSLLSSSRHPFEPITES